jgi:hypothetical protein
MSQQDGIDFRVDNEGKWYGPDGKELNEASLYFLTQNLRFDKTGYFIAMSFGPAKVHVEDVPFVITGIAVEVNDENERIISLTIMDGASETLDPATLSVKGEHYYCMIRSGRIPARFLPDAKQELEKYLKHDGDAIYLTL